MTEKISIIAPVFNEAGNIEELVKRIDAICNTNCILYEIIFIDDYSTDATFDIISSLKEKYTIQYHKKIGKKGKANSLLQGFSYAKNSLVCMIDADLQYPPEKIPEMIKKIHTGADIVIAQRDKKRIPVIRKMTSIIFESAFCRILHNLQFDIQSGLKVFKKEILERISVRPTPWTFDMEFILRARDAGYAIEAIKISFSERKKGNSKVHILKTSFEIGWRAIQLKFRRRTIPFSPQRTRRVGQGFSYQGSEFIHYSGLSNTNNAFFQLSFNQKLLFSVFGILLIFGIMFDWHTSIIILISAITFLYFSDLLFNLFVIYKSFQEDAEVNVTSNEISRQKKWPTYSILCPLYREGPMLRQFIGAIKKLSYPKKKLQVIILLEEDDKETIRLAQSLLLPTYFTILVVPNSLPKTKPKACNYALREAIGEYVVVYDAEDIPDPLQLKKTVIAFQKKQGQVQCIQAKLNFYNTKQNALTRMFTAEYSLWFDVVLPGLQAIHAPIPLGGTSNHFLRSQLKQIGGWDSFNVTEDADLGMRLAKNGFTTAIVNSYTLEEANSSIRNWLSQRSRWVKGYIQTYFVHMRHPEDFKKNKIDFFTFQLVIGGKVLSALINPLMWALTILYFAFRWRIGALVDSFFLPPIFYMAVVSLFLGNFLYTYYYMLAAIKRNQWSLVYYALATPIYWVFISCAAFYGIYELLYKPHYWHKTQHGLHLQPASSFHPFGEKIKLSTAPSMVFTT